MSFEIKCNKCGNSLQIEEGLKNDEIEIFWFDNKLFIECNKCNIYFSICKYKGLTETDKIM